MEKLSNDFLDFRQKILTQESKNLKLLDLSADQLNDLILTIYLLSGTLIRQALDNPPRE